MPKPLLASAMQRAKELGRTDAGDDLFLLAILDLPGDAVARKVLQAEGATADLVVRSVRRSDGAAPDANSIRFPPAYNETLGRAQGFAATLGDGTITPEHVLLSLIWDPTNGASQVLWHLGVHRERLIDRLRDLGVLVPAADPPEQREIETGDRVWFRREDTDRVLRYLSDRLPDDAWWGFNYEGDRAWVRSETRIDVESLVAEAIAQT